MNPEDPIGIIELGNTSLKCLIFKINSDNTFEILSTSKHSSQGIHNGVIVNSEKASETIRSCITSAEKKANIFLKKINVIIEQQDFLCTRFSKHKKIDGSKIHKEDIAFLLSEGKKQVTENDNKQTIIHIFNHNYIVDGKAFIEEPINVFANLLSHEMTFITMPKSNLKNINNVFLECEIEVERIFSSIFAQSVKLLKYNKLQEGAILIDLELEKTSIGIFKNLALIHSQTFPIGINHLKKDLSKICSLNPEDSNNVISNIDYSFENNLNIFDDENNLKKSYFKNSISRKISKNLITSVVKARLDEIFSIIKKQITISGIEVDLDMNFFIIGEGFNISNLENYFLKFFDLNKKKIEKCTSRQGNSLENDFISCLGALKIIKEGWETEAIPESVGKKVEKIGFLSKIFGK